MRAKSAVAVRIMRCEWEVSSGQCVHTTFQNSRFASLECALRSHFPFFLSSVTFLDFFLCALFRRGLFPVGLNSLRSGLAWSPASPPRFAVVVERHVIHFLRRIGGFERQKEE